VSTELVPVTELARKYPAADDRYINAEGKVAVVYSPQYGGGWSTWTKVPPTHPVIAALVDQGRIGEITDELMETLGYPGEYLGGLHGAQIEWLTPGTPFQISEYDGSESVDVMPENIWRA
jgi:hypothetical protein